MRKITICPLRGAPLGPSGGPPEGSLPAGAPAGRANACGVRFAQVGASRKLGLRPIVNAAPNPEPQLPPRFGMRTRLPFGKRESKCGAMRAHVGDLVRSDLFALQHPTSLSRRTKGAIVPSPPPSSNQPVDSKNNKLLMRRTTFRALFAKTLAHAHGHAARRQHPL